MSKTEAPRACALSIAGLDPCGGAGLLADIKTFEANGVLGLGVCSALTYQNHGEFVGLDWVPQDKILAQIAPLLKRYEIGCIKIGLIENLSALEALLSYLEIHLPSVPLIWDPVAKASAGFIFHDSFDSEQLARVLKKLTLLTPNQEEAKLFGANLSTECPCAVLEKSKHQSTASVCDELRFDNQNFEFKGQAIEHAAKHGSGCVLSAAIAAALAKGEPLLSACASGRRYSERYLSSSKSLIGFHGSHVS